MCLSFSTQCTRLLDYFTTTLKRPAELMRFPGMWLLYIATANRFSFFCADRTTAIGGIIDKYLKKQLELDDHAAHLLFSANRWEVK